MAPASDERLAELTERLENGVRDLYASGRYADYLSAMSKFHHYSFGNALLILFQCPHATNVAGYGTWKKLGRQVKKGEQGIQILAPCGFRAVLEREKIDPQTGQTVYGPDGQPLTEKVKISPNRFRITYVFDLSQTEGRELPAIVSDLDGDVENYTSIYERLAALSPLPVQQEDFPRSAKGYTSFVENRIVIKPGMSQRQTIKTLVHEIAHAKLHKPADLLIEETAKQRRQKEVEAESVAFVVCQHFGLDTSEYSFGYVAGWSRGKELAELKTSLHIIHSTAGEIIDAIQPPPPELTRSEPSQQFQKKNSHQKRRKRK